jgi:hypothetical protein
MKPAFSNTGTTCDCIRNSEGPMNLKLAAWVNPHKDDRSNPDKVAICEQITQMIADHRLTFGIKIEHMPSQDYNENYQIGRMNLFANSDKPPQAAAPAPAAPPAAPTAPVAPPAPGGYRNG